MTREEIIEQLKLAIGLIKQDGKDWLDDRDIPILEECVKALSQEPCDDAISRENAITSINKLYEECEEWRALNDLQYGKNQGLSLAIDVIEDLPPVTPSCDKCAMNGSGSKYCDNCGSKSGKWNKYYTSQKGNDVFNCKECGHTFVVTQGKDNMNFCPNCGCRMVEPQESEDKERIKAIPSAEPNMTWVTGADGAKIAFKDVPVWKVTKICEILGEPQESEDKQ